MISQLWLRLKTVSNRRLITLVSLIVVGGSLVLLLLSLSPFAQAINPVQSLNPQALLKNALAWVDSLGSISAIAFIGIYIVATVAFVPGSILTLGAGAVFGIVLGSLYAFTGAVLGATAAFLIGRYLARDWVESQVQKNNRFKAIDEAVGQEGFKIVCLTRLSPIIPFIMANYAYGVTKVSLKDYLFGSIGMIPGTIMYVYIGSLVGNVAVIGTQTQPVNSGLQWILRILGFVATVTVTIYITQIASKALNKASITQKE